jgi:hypothetical protein
MPDAKITPALADTVADQRDDDLVEIVVELAAAAPPVTGTRAARVEAMKSGFAAEAAPVEEAIRRAGGEVVSRAWLNQTMVARVPCGALDDVCRLGEVRRLDRPRRLEPD